jgi:hypothetical protein
MAAAGVAMAALLANLVITVVKKVAAPRATGPKP